MIFFLNCIILPKPSRNPEHSKAIIPIIPFRLEISIFTEIPRTMSSIPSACHQQFTLPFILHSLKISATAHGDYRQGRHRTNWNLETSDLGEKELILPSIFDLGPKASQITGWVQWKNPWRLDGYVFPLKTRFIISIRCMWPSSQAMVHQSK